MAQPLVGGGYGVNGSCYAPDFLEFPDAVEPLASTNTRDSCRFFDVTDLPKSLDTLDLRAPWEAVLVQPLGVITTVGIVLLSGIAFQGTLISPLRSASHENWQLSRLVILKSILPRAL